MFYSQAGQDQFIINVLNGKRNGYFLEIGSNHPSYINNTYKLEKEYDWTGLMVEYDAKWEQLYKAERKSNYIIADATGIDYRNKFQQLNYPTNMDYLQIDLEVNNGSTIKTLENLHSNILPFYKFAIVTFEHDIYRGNYFNTRTRSREIFATWNYHCVYKDVANDSCVYEDWYVHPDLVDMQYIRQIESDKSMNWQEIIKILDKTRSS
jgi:hypothetical protein